MRHGKIRGGQAGITYIGILLLISVVGLSLTQAVQVLTTTQQRERETQLLFVGEQYRAAIDGYYHSGTGGHYPLSLDALVEDNRQINPIRHLRRIYVDPLTGSADWGVVRSPDGGIMGVFSQAVGEPRKRQNFPDGYEAFNDAKSYRDWVFIYKQAPHPESQTTVR